MRQVIVIFLFLSTGLNAQYYFNDNCKQAYNNLIYLKLDKGKQILTKEKSHNPDNLYPYMLENYRDFLYLLITEEEDEYDVLKENIDTRLDKLETGDKSSPYYRYSIAQVNIQWSMIRMKFKDYFSALMELSRAYRLLTKNEEEFPDFLPNKLALGFMHVLIGTVPDNYKWMTSLLNYEGTVHQGTAEVIDYLNLCQQSNQDYLIPEGLFFLTFIQITFAPDYSDRLLFENELDSLSYTNLLLSFAYSRLLHKRGRNEKALDILLNRPKGTDYLSFYYLDYLTGISYLYKLDPIARKYLNQFVSNFKGKNFIKEAYQKIAWSYLIDGDTNAYFNTMNKVLLYGEDNSESDEIALKEAEAKYLPNVDLLKVRLLFDGGYYPEADSVLKIFSTKEKSQDEELEFLYRSARVYHNWGKLNDAIDFYKKTISKGSDSKKYFAGNAALKLANIYETSGNYPNSRKYYKLCLELSFDEFEKSIHQRAKAGLKRLDDLENKD